MTYRTNTLRDFWNHVAKSNSCWEWTGKLLQRSGYGRIRIAGTTQRAHRLSYEIHFGTIPDGLCVCHRCDNPKCVNPSHLFLGTHQDNLMDKHIKGRHAFGDRNGSRTRPDRLKRGDDHPRRKLESNDVLKIRASGVSLTDYQKQHALAVQYSVTVVLIRKILRRDLWKHI